MNSKIIDANEEMGIVDLMDNEKYVVTLDAKGKFLKEVIEILAEDDETFSLTISRCLSFCRMCKEIENKGGELRFRLNGKTYNMKFPKK